MATYKNPKYKPLEEAGKSNQRQFLRSNELSIGNARSADYKPTKTSGVKTRGNGAATKGVTARGPMA
jgi:hypothetical protein